MSYFVYKTYKNLLKKRMNKLILTSVKQTSHKLFENYQMASNNYQTNPIDLINRIMIMMFPRLILPDHLFENKEHLSNILQYLINIISPVDIFNRIIYQDTLDNSTQLFIKELFNDIGTINIDIYSIIQLILNQPHPVNCYLLITEYQYLNYLKTDDINLDDDQLNNIDNIRVGICCCGRLTVNNNECKYCNQSIKQFINYIDLIYIREHLSNENLNHCPITLEQFDENTKIGILSCGHYGEKNALKQWVCLNDICHYTRCQIEPIILPSLEYQSNLPTNITNIHMQVGFSQLSDITSEIDDNLNDGVDDNLNNGVDYGVNYVIS